MPLTSRSILLSLFNSCYNTVGWFEPLTKAIEGLTDAQSQLRNANDLSIREIVIHLVYWHERCLTRFNGIDLPPAPEDNSLTFKDEILSDHSVEWETLRSRLFAVMDEWNTVITTVDEELLSTDFPGNKDYPNWRLLVEMSGHIAYHTGQIVSIRKAHGIWLAG